MRVRGGEGLGRPWSLLSRRKAQAGRLSHAGFVRAPHPSKVGEEAHQNVPGKWKGEARNAGSWAPDGVCSVHPTALGWDRPYLECGKGDKITASEQVVRKLLKNSVKYERRHFTEQS